MLTSKDLIAQADISRATLNNYINLGLVPKPEVKRLPPPTGEPLTTIGYFPDWVATRIQEIRALKRAGLSMDAICTQLNGKQPTAAKMEASMPPDILINDNDQVSSPILLKDNRNTMSNNNYNKTLSQESISVTIDNIPYPAYMMNYDFGLVWLNQAAKNTFFSNTTIPDRAEDRSLIPTLLSWSEPLSANDKDTLLGVHFNAIKQRLTATSLAKNIIALSVENQLQIERCYAQASAPENAMIQESVIDHPTNGRQRVFAISFREGVLFTYAPEHADVEQLLGWLSQRDSVIRTLLSQRLPALTKVAVMVADLQNSVRICSELPPEEYFQLINEIWSTLDPIYREHFGAYGKHTGDGMVYYFFPQPDRNYLMNAMACACKVREVMKGISHAWSLKKGWHNQLYMNIGLSEGEEWLGTFKTNTNYELVVLGETINIGARLSDFARFGRIWATKNLVSKLSPSEREHIEYGVQRKGVDQEVFVANTYAQVGTLCEKDDPRAIKLQDIASCAVTEIRSVKV
jgi:class 3 adenylate cyclase/DNA-binding transcriptional MerR regulator